MLGAIAAVVAVLLGVQHVAAQGRVICVYSAMNTPGSGRCWSDPYRSLSTALSVAQAGDEIWVARGFYTAGLTVDSTFVLRPGVALYGGFSTTETLRTQRNWAANVTVLSGDLQRNDRADGRGVVTSTAFITGVNAAHVVLLDGSSEPITRTTRLDGFSITAGRATTGTQPMGGGLLCLAQASGGECSPALSNLTLSGNLAQQGGGLYIAVGQGGRSDLALDGVTFSGNRGLQAGGGLYAVAGSGGSASLTLTNAVFRDNSAASGGALYSLAQAGGVISPTLTNVTLGRNTADAAGGALYNATGADIPLTNVILWANTAPAGAQIYNDGSTPVINFSLVQGGDGGIGGSSGRDAFSRGAGNLDRDPLYTPAPAGNLNLLPTSPAIDAGSTAAAPAADLRGQPRPARLAADMGAYEVQPYTLLIKGGDGQAVGLGSPFRLPLTVTLASRAGDPVGPGAVLTFTPPASGPGLAVTTPFTVATNGTGVVTTPVAANALLGVYPVTVTANGAPTPAVFTLTNGCPTGRAYVNHAATGTGSGESWQDAYTELQEALRLATACDSFSELWVARGVYTPGVSALSTFTITAGVALYGGFGATETLRSERNWAANVTVLSGDLDNNDLKDADGVITNTAQITGSNAYHVVWMDGASRPITASTQLDGFTITGGKAKGGGVHNSGGGLVCFGQGAGKSCSPTIANVVLRGNAAAGGGGAMYNTGRVSGVSNPTLVNVAFIGNTAGTSGGAMYNAGSSGVCSPVLMGVTLSGNVASNHGGAIYNYGLQGVSSPVLTGVVFSQNAAANYAGAMYNYGSSRGVSSPVLANVLFIGNRARRGGALYNNGGIEGRSSPALTNVTFSRNTATEYGAVLYNYGQYAGTSRPALTNAIMWGNTALSGTQIYNVSAAPTINFSLLQGGDSGIGGDSGADAFSTGSGNLNRSPLFANAAAGQLGLLPGSPAVDAGADTGAPVTDLRWLPRPQVVQTDMGAYEMQGFTLAITGGDGQTADVLRTFALPLGVRVDGGLGEMAGPGGVVTVTPPVSGPGLSVTAPFTLTTDASGLVRMGVTANSEAGVYTVAVSTRGALAPALFTLTNQYTLTVAASATPLGGGRVSGAGRANHGAVMTVTAAANDGYVFVHWTEGEAEVSTLPVYSFALTGDRSLVAHFAPVGPVTHSVRVLADPAAGGAAGGGGQVNSGELVTVTATASPQYVFVNWTENDGAVSTEGVYSFVAAADRTLVAHFVALPPVSHNVTVSADPPAGGAAGGGGAVTHGAVMTVTAAASPQYAFVHWVENGVVVSTDPVYSFAALADRALVAHFGWLGPVSRSVSVSAEPPEGGSVAGGGTVVAGEVMTVTAAANSGYAFAYWVEDDSAVSTAAVYSFVAASDRILVAQFSQITPEEVTVTVSADPAAGGAVRGGGRVEYGETAVVAAAANPHYEFVNWTERGVEVATEAEYSFAATENHDLVAHFRWLGPVTFLVQLLAEPAAGGVAGGGGTVYHGDVVTATAAANSGYAFVHWTEGGAVVSTAPIYTFTAAERTLTAHFRLLGPGPRLIVVSADPPAGGAVAGGGLVGYGETATVTATANVGYTFLRWAEDGGEVSPAAVYTFTAAADRALVAHFEAVGPEQRTISASADPPSGGAVSGGGTYNAGDVVTVTAAARSGYTFVNWTEGGVEVSLAASYSFAAAADRALVAHFRPVGPDPRLIVVSAAPAVGGVVHGGGLVGYGETAVVTAAANPQYVFVNWTEEGVEVSTAAVYSFTAGKDRTLVAHFSAVGPLSHTVQVSADPAAGGTVHGGGTYNAGDLLTATAAASAGYRFVHWTEGGAVVSAAPEYRFAVSADHLLVAHFEVVGPEQKTVSVRAEPLAGGLVNGGGLFAQGDPVTVTAAANSGYTFVRWMEGGAVVSHAAAYGFVVESDRALAAQFSPLGPQPLHVGVRAEPAAGGTVSGGGWVNVGEMVTVTAAANGGYVFVNWSEGGAVVSSNASYRFAAAADRALVAHFQAVGPLLYTVLAGAEPLEGGVVSGGGSYNAGDAVTVMAAANDGYAWLNWTEGGVEVSAAASYSFAATAHRTLVAHFQAVGPDPRLITVHAEPAAGGVASGGGLVAGGATVTVQAAAHTGYVFVRWTEGGAEVAATPGYTFIATANRALTAHFQALGPVVHTVSAGAEPPAGGVVSGGGTVNHGDLVTVTAAANAGYRLLHWTEGGLEVSAAPACRFAATADRVLVAHFSRNQYTVSAAAEPPEGGVVSGGGTANHGDVVTVTAAANAGYRFVHWTEGGAEVSSAAAYSFAATADRVLVAHFSLLPRPLARNDAAGALANAEGVIAVTANDRDPAGGGLAVIGAAAPAHGVAAISADQRSVVYTPNADDAGIDSFLYEIADANGSRDTGLVVVVVADSAAGQGAAQTQIVADPSVDSTAVFVLDAPALDAAVLDAPALDAARITLSLPAGFYGGALAEEDVLFFAFLPMTRPSEQAAQPPPGFRFANLEFDLLAFVNDQPLAGVGFAVPVTATIVYAPALLDGFDPATTGLWRWTGSEWSTAGISVANHDLANHALTLAITHASRFALFGAALGPDAGAKVYLPIIKR